MKTRIYRLKLMGWRLYLTNCRMKKMNPRKPVSWASTCGSII